MGDWTLYGLQFAAAQANGSTTLRVYQNGAGSGDFYVDGVQVEEKEYWTTYCDGGQDGCEWNGTEHASTSQRSGQSRAGGRVCDLLSDYYLDIGGMMGTGAAPQSVSLDSYALLPGGQVSNIKVASRVFTLAGVIRGTSWSDVHSKKQALIEVLDPDAYPGQQPVRLRYTGAAVMKEIAATYEGGLEGQFQASQPYYWERVAIRFLAADPFWYEVGESAKELDVSQDITTRLVARRYNGEWDGMGPPAVGGTYTAIYRMVAGPDGCIYIGGNFTDFDNQVNADYIVKYDPVADSYSPLASGLTGSVWGMAFAPDGTLYVVGEFTDAGGDANADYICQWNGTAFSAVGIPNSGGASITVIRDVVVAQNGDVYVGGTFTDLAGEANADYAAYYDISASSWEPVAAGCNGTVTTVAVAPNGDIYLGGSFTDWGDANGDCIVKWDGSSLSSLSIGADNTVEAIAIDNAGTVYIGGTFTTAGGTSAARVAKWNGVMFTALGDGLSGVATPAVQRLAIAPDGSLFASGFLLSSSGDLTLYDSIAKWNGASWSRLDLDLPAGQSIRGLALTAQDPVIEQNYDIYVGCTVTGTAGAGVATIVSNAGTASVYPVVYIKRDGAYDAPLILLRNETTGKELLLDYDLLDGEELVIDLTPTEKSVVSNYFGSRPEAILPNSDFGSFVLQPGSNTVTCFVNTSSAATITAHLLWRDPYKSQD